MANIFKEQVIDAPSSITGEKSKTSANSENIGQYFDLYITTDLDPRSFKAQAEASIKAVEINTVINEYNHDSDKDFQIRDFIAGFVSPYAGTASENTKGLKTSKHINRYLPATPNEIQNSNIVKFKKISGDDKLYKLDTDHMGIDLISGDNNLNLFSTQSGIVKKYPDGSSRFTGYGNVVVIRHAYKNVKGEIIKLPLVTMYAHLASFETSLKDDEYIDKYTPIGVQGSTGGSNIDSHLHLELRYIKNLNEGFKAATKDNSIDYSNINNIFKAIGNFYSNYTLADSSSSSVYSVTKKNFDGSTNINTYIGKNIGLFYNKYTKASNTNRNFSNLNNTVSDFININKYSYDNFFLKNNNGNGIEKLVYTIKETKKDSALSLKPLSIKEMLTQQNSFDNIPDARKKSALFTFYFPFRINLFSKLYKTVPANTGVTFTYYNIFGNHAFSMSNNSNLYLKCEILDFPWKYDVQYLQSQGFAFYTNRGIIDNLSPIDFKNLFSISMVELNKDFKELVTSTQNENTAIYHFNIGKGIGNDISGFDFDFLLGLNNSEDNNDIFSKINITIKSNNVDNINTFLNENTLSVIDVNSNKFLDIINRNLIDRNIDFNILKSYYFDTYANNVQGTIIDDNNLKIITPNISCFFDQMLTYEEKTESGPKFNSLNGEETTAITATNCFGFFDKLSFLDNLPSVELADGVKNDNLKSVSAKNFINYPFVTSAFFENMIFTDILPLQIYQNNNTNIDIAARDLNESKNGYSTNPKFSRNKKNIDIYKVDGDNGLFQLKINQKELYKFIIHDMINIELFSITEDNSSF